MNGAPSIFGDVFRLDVALADRIEDGENASNLCLSDRVEPQLSPRQYA